MPAELPDRPDLDFLRRVAKDLIRAARAGDEAALARLGSANPRLADAQRVVACDHGFASWTALRAEVERRRGVTRRPRRADDYLAASTFGAEQFVEAITSAGWRPTRLPTAIVFVFQGLLAHWLDANDAYVEDRSLAVGNGRYFAHATDPVGVSCISPGATAMATQVENQLALCGASRFVLLNLAGGITPDVAPA